jgi:hypothetical protein
MRNADLWNLFAPVPQITWAGYCGRRRFMSFKSLAPGSGERKYGTSHSSGLPGITAGQVGNEHCLLMAVLMIRMLR